MKRKLKIIRKKMQKITNRKPSNKQLKELAAALAPTKLDYIDQIKIDLEKKYMDSLENHFGPDLELGKVLQDITKISIKYRKELLRTIK